jgi:hypothetical protein
MQGYLIVDQKTGEKIFITGPTEDHKLETRLEELSQKHQSGKFRLDGDFVYYKKKKDGIAVNGCSESTLSWGRALSALSSPQVNAVASVAHANQQSPVLATTSDNPSIESWAKTCSPFTAPIDLEKQISQGKITFRGIKVAAVDSADGDSNSLVTIRLAMSFTDFKTQYPEFNRKSRIPKSKTCPLGGTRSLAEQSFTGIKGATIECNCLTGGE